MEKKNFYLTTTLPYVNAPLHMGHALELIRADAMARYKKLRSYDVYFNTGTDEHGIKIYEKAREEGINPEEFVNRGFETFQEQLKNFGISSDVHFIRTTNKHHERAAQEFWKIVKNNGYIYKKDYEAKYCIGCESEKTESELNDEGECLIHPGRKLEVIKEENYFFKYSQFQDRLLKFYEENPGFVVPSFRFNEIKNFVSGGLTDFSISRQKSKMPWGIEVPGDPDHVMYVWFDALVNYISTLGWPEDTVNFKKYWVNGSPTQYCGKDNTRFQGAMWQAMLMAANLPTSHQIIVDGFITGENGVRMSKTLGNVINPKDIAKEFGVDALRFFLLKEISNFEDSPFSMERFRNSYNANLANGLGNLVSRIMTMAENYGVKLKKDDLNIEFFKDSIEELEDYDINRYMNEIWENLGSLDQFIQKNEPFKKIKTNKEEAKKDVEYLLTGLYKASLALEPMMPETSLKIKNLIIQNKKPEVPLFVRREAKDGVD